MRVDRSPVQERFVERYHAWIDRADELIAWARAEGGPDTATRFGAELAEVQGSRRRLQEDLVHLRDADDAEFETVRRDAEAAAADFKVAMEELRERLGAARPKPAAPAKAQDDAAAEADRPPTAAGKPVTTPRPARPSRDE